MGAAARGLTGLAVSLIVSARFFPGHKHGHIHHLAPLALADLVRGKLVQLGLQPALLVVRQLGHVDGVLHVGMPE